MSILHQLDQASLQPVLNSLKRGDLLICDTNLDPELIRWIVTEAPCPLGDGSAQRIQK